MKFRLPPDPTPEELQIYEIVNQRVMVYQKLVDPIDKFIVAFVFDMGYTRQDAAEALGITYKTVWKRTKHIRQVLSKAYHLKLTQGNEMAEKLVE